MKGYIRSVKRIDRSKKNGISDTDAVKQFWNYGKIISPTDNPALLRNNNNCLRRQ